MDLQSVCQDVMDDVDGSLGCVLTDLETGLPLAAECRAGTVMNGNMITLVSHVGIDLFRGKLVRNFERSLSRNHGSPEGFVREIQLTTTTTYQFMSAVPGWDQVIFILVTNKNVSIGMGLLAVHDTVRRLGEIATSTATPAANPMSRPREEPAETPPAPQPESRRPERDIAFEAPQQREVPRDWTPELPQRGDTGFGPQPGRSAASLARVSGVPEAGVSEAPAPEAPPREATAAPAPPPTPPVREMREVVMQPAEETHAEPERVRSGVRLDEAKTEEDTPSAVPIGPRARMFFKRPREESRRDRRRRS